MTYDITRHDDQLRSSFKKSQVSEFPYRREREESQWPGVPFSFERRGLEVSEVMVSPSRDPRHGKSNGVP